MTEDKDKEARLVELLKPASEGKPVKLTDEILKLMEQVQREKKGRDPAA